VDCTAGTIRGTGRDCIGDSRIEGHFRPHHGVAPDQRGEQKSDHVQVRAGDARLALPASFLLATCRAATDVGQRVLSASGVGRSCRVDAALRPFSRNSRFRSTGPATKRAHRRACRWPRALLLLDSLSAWDAILRLDNPQTCAGTDHAAADSRRAPDAVPAGHPG
jgi:hypothetical protein